MSTQQPLQQISQTQAQQPSVQNAQESKEFTLLPPVAVQEQILLNPITANKETHLVFALKYLTQKTIERFYAAEQARTSNEVGQTVTETSMLSHDQEQEKKRVIEELRTKYLAKLDSLGGIDGVLTNLQAYIVEEITKIDKSFVEADQIKAKRQFVVAESDKPIGRLKTALRALLDPETEYWQSVFHPRSTHSYVGVPFREILAYYWLAASDDDMELEYVTEDTKTEREDKLRYSKENFVVVLSEIRRAHNEYRTTNAPLDNPSCTMGTFGRITCSSNMYNPIGRQRANPYKSDELTKQVMLFVKGKFTRLSPDDKINIGQYLSELMYMGEGSPEKKERLLAFIKNLMLDTSIDELMQHMNDNTHVLKFLFTDNNPIKTLAVREMIKDFLQVHAYSLLEPSKFEPDSVLFNGILEDSFGPGLEKGLSELKGFRETIHKDLNGKSYELATKLVILKQKCLHEQAKCLLFNEYQLQSGYQNKIRGFIAEMASLKGEFDSYYKEKLDNYATVAKESIDTLKSDGQLPHTSPEHLQRVQENLSAMLSRVVQSVASPRTLQRIQFAEQSDQQSQRLIAATSSPKDFQNELPKPPSLDTYQYGNSPISWANYVIALASGTYRKKGREKPSRQTIEALRAAEREMIAEIFDLLEFMESKDKDGIIREIKSLLENPAILARLNKNDPENHHLQFIKKKMQSEAEIGIPKDNKSAAYALDRFKTLVEQKTVDEIAHKTIFVESGFDIDEDSPLAASDIKMMLAHKKVATEMARKNLAEWQKTAISFFRTETSNRLAVNEAAMNKLKGFVYLTVCRNLGIDYTHKNNIETLEWLCEKYMIEAPTDMSTMLFPIAEMNSASIEKKIAMLSAHLSVLLTIIENAKQLFLSGHLCLMTRDKAADAILGEKKADRDPFLLRVSNSDPTKVSGNFSISSTQDEQDLESEDIAAITNPVTATIRIPNIRTTFEVSKIYERDIAEWLSRKRQERGGRALTTSIFGSVPIEEVIQLRSTAAQVAGQARLALSQDDLLAEENETVRQSAVPRTGAGAQPLPQTSLAYSLGLESTLCSYAERPAVAKNTINNYIAVQLPQDEVPEQSDVSDQSEVPGQAASTRRGRYIKRVSKRRGESRGNRERVPPEIKRAKAFFASQKKKLLENTESNSVAFETLKSSLLQFGFEEVVNDGNNLHRATRIQEVETKQKEELIAQSDAGFRILPAVEKNAFKIIYKTTGGVINTVVCNVTQEGIFGLDPINNIDFRVSNLEALLKQINLRIKPNSPEKTLADLKGLREAKSSSDTTNKKLFVFDFDQTIVNAHWHYLLAKLDVEPGYPSKNILEFLMDKMQEESAGIKNRDALRKLFREILSKGHHLSIRSHSLYPGAIRYVLSELGLSPEEIDIAYQDPDLSETPKNESKGKNAEIIEDMLRFGISHPAQVTLIDDLEINLTKARQIGVFGIDSNITSIDKRHPLSEEEAREFRALNIGGLTVNGYHLAKAYLRLNNSSLVPSPRLEAPKTSATSRPTVVPRPEALGSSNASLQRPADQRPANTESKLPAENKLLRDNKDDKEGVEQFRQSILDGYSQLQEFAFSVLFDTNTSDNRRESKSRNETNMDETDHRAIDSLNNIILKLTEQGNDLKTKDELKILADFNTVLSIMNPLKEKAKAELKLLIGGQLQRLTRLLALVVNIVPTNPSDAVPHAQNPTAENPTVANNTMNPLAIPGMTQALLRAAEVIATNSRPNTGPVARTAVADRQGTGTAAQQPAVPTVTAGVPKSQADKVQSISNRLYATKQSNSQVTTQTVQSVQQARPVATQPEQSVQPVQQVGRPVAAQPVQPTQQSVQNVNRPVSAQSAQSAQPRQQPVQQGSRPVAAQPAQPTQQSVQNVNRPVSAQSAQPAQQVRRPVTAQLAQPAQQSVQNVNRPLSAQAAQQVSRSVAAQPAQSAQPAQQPVQQVRRPVTSQPTLPVQQVRPVTTQPAQPANAQQVPGQTVTTRPAVQQATARPAVQLNQTQQQPVVPRTVQSQPQARSATPPVIIQSAARQSIAAQPVISRVSLRQGQVSGPSSVATSNANGSSELPAATNSTRNLILQFERMSPRNQPQGPQRRPQGTTQGR